MIDKKLISNRFALKHYLGFTEEEISEMEQKMGQTLDEENNEPKFWTILKTPIQAPRVVDMDIGNLTSAQCDAIMKKIRDKMLKEQNGK